MSAKRRALIVAAVLLLAWMLISWLVVIQPIRGRVIDATTGRPVPGAVVTGAWIRKHMGFQEALYGGPYRVVEAVTDRSGTYELPAWFGVDIHGPLTARAVSESPQLYIFAPGYEPRTAANARPAHTLMVRRSLWNGKDILLTPAAPRSGADTSGAVRQANAELRHFQLEIERLVGSTCSWEHVARILSALWRYGKALGIDQTVGPLSTMPQIRGCHQEKYFEQDAQK